MTQIYPIEVTNIEGKTTTLHDFEGKVLLIVNVASKCGFTSQYKGLQTIYDKYKDQGFVVLGFPCNQFGHQEPGNEEEIKSFCSLNYDVTFPMFSKIDVNGDDTHPLYKILKAEAPGVMGTEGIKWNFTKFLISRTGEVIERYAPTTTPEGISNKIEEALK